MIWNRDRHMPLSKSAPDDQELVFARVREVEAKLRKSLAIFREHLDELEAEIAQSRRSDEEV